MTACEYIDFNSTEKDFYLFDTFDGIPEEQLQFEERKLDRQSENLWYPECYELARRNFAPFPRAHLVRGKIPESLSFVDVDQVAYFCLDLNIEYPETEALKFFWPKLVSGGIIVMDDYGFLWHRPQKEAHDAFAREHGLEIFCLPTGQGLLIKP